MTDDHNATVLAALAALELKLTTLIRDGLDMIQRQHASALLEQAKLNGTFAHRDRVDALAQRLDRHEEQLTGLHRQDDLGAAERREIRLAIEDLTATLNNRSVGLFASATTTLLSGGFILAGVLLTFILTHLGHLS